MRNECNIIRDLLPLYVETITSPDTAEYVENHLKTCEACQVRLKELQDARSLLTPQLPDIDSVAPLKRLRRKLRLRRLLAVLLTMLISAILCLVGFYLLLYGYPSHSTNFTLSPEFQYAEGAYLNQEFVLHIERNDGKPLNVTTHALHTTEIDGVPFIDGYELTVREMLFDFGQHAPSYTTGYAYGEVTDEAPSSDYDFTLIVHFSDRTITYSMTEEGLFVPQENVIRYP